MLRISSWMMTVLPTPAPPNRPILPPLAYGASRSTTLMPVSKISARRLLLLERRRRAVDRAVVFSGCGTGPLSSIGSPSRLKMRPRRLLAHRHRDRRAGVDRLHAAHQAVGGGHGDAAHDVVADVLRDLDREVDPASARPRCGSRSGSRAAAPAGTRTSTVGRSPVRPCPSSWSFVAVILSRLLQRFGAADDLDISFVIVAWRSAVPLSSVSVIDHLARVLASPRPSPACARACSDACDSASACRCASRRSAAAAGRAAPRRRLEDVVARDGRNRRAGGRHARRAERAGTARARPVASWR